MWCSQQDINNSNNNSNHKVVSSNSNSSSSSSSSSASSSSSSSSSSSVLPLTPRRSMEDVWKDITLSTLPHEIPTTPPISTQQHPNLPRITTSSTNSLKSIILQDFLEGPFKDAPPPPPPPPRRPNPHTPIVLSLNSSGHSDPNSNTSSQAHRYPFVSAALPPNAVIGSPSPAGVFAFCSKKRVFEGFGSGDGGDSGGGDDRRQKRMIKNRESASRSRARKQAYTNELELELAHLLEENAKLRRQYEELRLATAAQLPTKKRLQRTSTAPF